MRVIFQGLRGIFCEPKHLICLLLFWNCLFSVQAQGNPYKFKFGSPGGGAKIVRLGGTVLHPTDRSPIPQARIEVRSTKQVIETDSSGQFLIALASGSYWVVVSREGFENYIFDLDIYEDGQLELLLEEQVYELDAVLIQDDAAANPVKNVTAGLEKMDIRTMERKSRFMGETDVLRSLQSISGVSSVGEGASGFHVRGGNADENLILQENGLIMNPTHALGIFSLFHPDLVSGVELYKGGVPARFGGRLSSVLDVSLRDGNMKQISGKGGLGLTSSRLSLEGPIIKDKVSYLVGARTSYLNWLLRQVNNIDIKQSEASFYDVTAKVDARLGLATRVGFSVFSSNDAFQFADEVKIDYGSSAANFYLRHLAGEKVSLSADFNAGRYRSSLYDIQNNDSSQFSLLVDHYKTRLNSLIDLNDKAKLNFGLEGVLYQVVPGRLDAIGSSVVAEQALDRENGLELSAYLEGELKVWEVVEIALGLRFSHYRRLGPGTVFLYAEGQERSLSSVVDTLQFKGMATMAHYQGLEPRLSVKWNLNEAIALKLGYNRTYQYISQISNTASAAPVDLWKLSDYHVRPQYADSYSLGYFQNFEDLAIRASATAFYRDIHLLIDYKDFARLLLNDHLEVELLEGIGRAYGLELSFQKQKGKHQLESNYTYSQTERKVSRTGTQPGVNGGNWYPSYYNKPHTFNLNYFFQPSLRHQLSVNFTYSTGRPATAPIGTYANSNVLNIPIYSERNQYRIPAYHRLDLAYTLDFARMENRRWENSWTFSIFNVYGRKNAYSVFFRQTPFEKVSAYRISVLGSVFPSITYNFRF